jgi:small-conductance mechanosensitive channel
MDWVDGAIAAAIALLVAGVAALLARRMLDHAGALASDRVDPVLATRFRVIRRLVVASILTVGVFIAISQISALDQLATSLLASTAILAATVGFASRLVLGNAIAGVQLAVAQPVRIGDTITVDGETGVVEDVRLTSTYIRTAANARIIVPNEEMISAIVRNDTIISPEVGTEVVLWLPADADAGRAADELRDETAGRASIRIADMSPEGAVKLVVSGPVSVAAQRVVAEGELRAGCLRRLRAAGLLPGPRPPAPPGGAGGPPPGPKQTAG